MKTFSEVFSIFFRFIYHFDFYYLVVLRCFLNRRKLAVFGLISIAATDIVIAVVRIGVCGIEQIKEYKIIAYLRRNDTSKKTLYKVNNFTNIHKNFFSAPEGMQC